MDIWLGEKIVYVMVLNYVTRDDNIILLDKNFNVLKPYSGDYVSDMSYINGVYYINTYSQYGDISLKLI